MTRDEIRAESFSRITAALNEVFPNIPSKADGDFLNFDGGAVKIEMSSCDAYEGYFDITNDEGSLGTLWGVKPVVNVLVRAICDIRRQKVLSTLR
jgi:hypothetical protein